VRAPSTRILQFSAGDPKSTAASSPKALLAHSTFFNTLRGFWIGDFGWGGLWISRAGPGILGILGLGMSGWGFDVGDWGLRIPH